MFVSRDGIGEAEADAGVEEARGKRRHVLQWLEPAGH
jgi:hypothetical protein